MTQNENNQKAFPVINQGNVYETGMTLRDYFANSAMQELIKYYYSTNKFLETIPKHAYEIADAMLKQRQLIDDFCECDSKNRNLDMSTYLVCKECNKKL
jgi:hypothetical protein